VARQNLDSLKRIDPELPDKARVLGQVALERGSSSSPEANELERVARGEPLESKAKSRLFANRE